MYQTLIRETLERTRNLRLMTVPPQAVEQIMRDEYGTLDHLPRDQFDREAILGAKVYTMMDAETQAFYREV